MPPGLDIKAFIRAGKMRHVVFGFDGKLIARRRAGAASFAFSACRCLMVVCISGSYNLLLLQRFDFFSEFSIDFFL